MLTEDASAAASASRSPSRSWIPAGATARAASAAPARRRRRRAATAPGSFRITEGEELVREWTPPGDGFIKAFCSVCGGHLYSRRADGWEVVAIRLGAVDGDPGIRPQYRQHVDSAAVWEPIPDDGLPRFPGRRA